MPESVRPVDALVDVQLEAIKALAQGFDKIDSSDDGSLHRETLVALAKIVAAADSSAAVKIAGLQSIGDYAVRNSSNYLAPSHRLPSVQKEAVDVIADAADREDDLKVKEAGLDQVARRLELLDKSNEGEIHGQAVDAILKIAMSVVVDKDDLAAAALVKKAIDLLSEYANRNSNNYLAPSHRLPSVQEKVKGYIELIATTAGVEKFADLNQKT